MATQIMNQSIQDLLHNEVKIEIKEYLDNYMNNVNI